MYGNAATNVALPVVTLTTTFSQMVGIGTASNSNINMGAKQEEEAQKFVGTGLILMAFLRIFIMLFVLAFKAPILWLWEQQTISFRMQAPIWELGLLVFHFF